MTMNDTHLRDALAPLRADEPSEAEVAAVLAAATPRPAPRAARPPHRGRFAAGLVTATATVALALAFLPGRERPQEGPQTAASVLHAAAAVAADQPGLAAFTGYRYTDWIEHWTWYPMRSPDGRMVGVTEEVRQRVETWVDRDWKGRRVSHKGQVIRGNERTRKGYFASAHDGPYQYGDGPRPDLARLPTEPVALRAALKARILGQNWAPGLPTPDQLHYDILRNVINLLGWANTTPSLRAALFEVLARMPGVRIAPAARDALGRGGQAVSIPTRQQDGLLTVIFDPQTSQMRYWSEIGSGGGTPDQEHTIVRAGQVAAIGDRPDR